MCPRPHLWFLFLKHRLSVENYKSLWVPDLTCRFVHVKQHDFSPELHISLGPRPHMSFYACKTACLAAK